LWRGPTLALTRIQGTNNSYFSQHWSPTC